MILADTLSCVTDSNAPHPADTPSPTKRGRPRDAAKDQLILQAAQDLLAEVGYEQFTMEAIATRVGASKATLYRRWASKAELVAGVIGDLEWTAPAPDTGSLREDLLALTDVWFAEDRTRDEIFMNLLAALPRDEKLRELFLTRVSIPRGAAIELVISRAIDRAELTGGTELEPLRGVLPALVFHRLAVEARPVDKNYIASVIDAVIIPALRAAGKPGA